MRRPEIIWLELLGATALTLGSAWIWFAVAPMDPVGISASAKPPQEAAADTGSAKFVMPPPTAFAEIYARPVFSPLRRPTPPPASTPVVRAAPPPAPPPNMMLIGILVGNNGRVAVLRPAGAGPAVTVTEGQDVSGWLVHQILVDRVVLRGATGETEIKFPVQSNSRGVPPGMALPGNRPLNGLTLSAPGQIR